MNRSATIGLTALIAMFAACVLTLPWTLGSASDVSGGSGSSEGVKASTSSRYEKTDLDRFLLPPVWASHTVDEEARLNGEDKSAHKPTYLLGSDRLGRDLLTRCLTGGGISLLIGLAAAAIAVCIGTTYGMLAGYLGGRVDAAMMRVVDVLYGLPYVLLVVLLAVAVDGLISRFETAAFENPEGHPFAVFIMRNKAAVNVITLLVAIGSVSWLTMARVVRGQVLSLKERPFMEACKAIGVPVHRQFLRHLLPNLMGPIVVYATLTVPQAILQESFLSFLGIGVQPPLPSWGNLAAEGLSELNPVRARWWLLLWPCVLLAITLLSLNFVGEGLRVLFDPKRRA